MPRSGTSWVGKMLESSREVVYVNEPLNPGHPPGRSPGVLDATVTHQFQYIDPFDDEAWRHAFARTLALRYGFVRELRVNRQAYDLARMAKYGTSFTLGRWTGRRAMLDDPFAVMCVPWLVQTFGIQALVLVRNPISLVGSYRTLGWKMRFDQLLDQPGLVRDLLVPDAANLADEAKAATTSVAAAALMWRTIYGVVDRHYLDIPGVTVRRYEDFVSAPVTEFRSLYDFFGLTWRRRVERSVIAATTGRGSSRASFRWTFRSGISRTAFRPMNSSAAMESARLRLADGEAARVRDIAGAVAAKFYPESQVVAPGQASAEEPIPAPDRGGGREGDAWIPAPDRGDREADPPIPAPASDRGGGNSLPW
jgi:hypothetical protein